MLYHDVPDGLYTSVTDAKAAKTDRATIVADVMKDLKDAAKVLPPDGFFMGKDDQRSGRHYQYWGDWHSTMRNGTKLSAHIAK